MIRVTGPPLLRWRFGQQGEAQTRILSAAPLYQTTSIHRPCKLPLMILNPLSKLQKNGFSCRNMHFPTEKCIFLQQTCTFLPKNAFSCRKMHFRAEKRGFQGAHGRKQQDIAEEFQGSRIKNASQLSQENSLAFSAVMVLFRIRLWGTWRGTLRAHKSSSQAGSCQLITEALVQKTKICRNQ